MRIGIDFHGVIDAKPDFFAQFTKMIVDSGGEVHILTGAKVNDELKLELKNLGISYTHLFSILDHHESLGTKIVYGNDNFGVMDSYLWDKTKAEYCNEHGIELHFDDSDTYGYFFKTPYARFYSKDTHRVKKLKI